MERVLDRGGVDGAVLGAGLLEDGAVQGQEPSGYALGVLEQGAETLLAEPLWGGKMVREEGVELLEAQAGDLLAHSDAPPQGGLGLELGAQLRQADEQDLDGAGAGEVALGDGARLGQGLLGQVVGLVEPQQQDTRILGQGVQQPLQAQGMAQAGTHAQALAEDLDQADGAELSGLGKGDDAVACAIARGA